MTLRNSVILPHYHTASEPRRTQFNVLLKLLRHSAVGAEKKSAVNLAVGVRTRYLEHETKTQRRGTKVYRVNS